MRAPLYNYIFTAKPLFGKKGPCRRQGALLNIEGVEHGVISHMRSEKGRIAAVAAGHIDEDTRPFRIGLRQGMAD